jgi:hypothetical protein
MIEAKPWSDEFLDYVRQRQEWLWNLPHWADYPMTYGSVGEAQRRAEGSAAGAGNA